MMFKNPLGNDYPDYVSQMISSKRVLGEQAVEGQAVLYKKFDGFGDDGSYSTEGGKYFWRIGEEMVFQIAFNTTHDPNEQYNAARKIAKAMTENYINL